MKKEYDAKHQRTVIVFGAPKHCHPVEPALKRFCSGDLHGISFLIFLLTFSFFSRAHYEGKKNLDATCRRIVLPCVKRSAFLIHSAPSLRSGHCDLALPTPAVRPLMFFSALRPPIIFGALRLILRSHFSRQTEILTRSMSE